MTTQPQTVLAVLTTGPKTPRELADSIGKSLSAVHTIMSDLSRRGLIARIDGRSKHQPGAVWALTGKEIEWRGTLEWSAETVAVLRERFAAGDSYAVIALKLGERFTRSAVSAKVNRLGLARERSQQAMTNGATMPRRQPVTVKPRVERAKAQPKPRPAAPVSRAAADPVSLLDLTPRSCRWPVNTWALGCGTEALFCGAPKGDGAYCAAHGQIAAGQPSDKRVMRLERLGR